jgi:integrase
MASPLTKAVSNGGQPGQELPLEHLKSAVLNSLRSPHSRRVFGSALDAFLSWCRENGRSPFDHAAVQRFRSHLESQRLAPSTINVYLSAIRKLASECAIEGHLDPQQAARITQVKGAQREGVRTGRSLTPEEASDLLLVPDVSTLKGARDRAILALLIGCALRRAELCQLTLEHLQRREGRWVIPDLAGKGQRLRTVPVPGWVKECLDYWALQAAIAGGRLFRSVNKGGVVWGEGISEDAVWAVTRECGAQIGQPTLSPHDLRRTCAQLCRLAGGALEQIQLLLGHASVQTTERYLGTRQELAHAVNDDLPIRAPALRAVVGLRKGPRRACRAHILAAAVPDARFPNSRAIEDTERLP